MRAASAEMIEASIERSLIRVQRRITTSAAAVVQKSGASCAVPSDTTRTIAFERETGSEAAAKSKYAERPRPARSEARLCAANRPPVWRSSCPQPPYCPCHDIEKDGHPYHP